MILRKFPLSGINKVILFYYFLKNSKLHMLSNVAVRLHIFPASTSRQLRIQLCPVLANPPHLLINPPLAVVIHQVL